jgi:GT2 family glycosyltransferase
VLSDPRPAGADPDDQAPVRARADGDVDDWTVVVPTRGDAAAAARIEDNIVNRLDGVPVMVVRNGGGRGEGMARRPDVEVVDVPGGGVSRARNAALAAATTRTVVFVDDDVVVSGAALRTLVSRQREAGATIACARILPADAAHHGLFDEDLGFDRGPVSRAWRLGADAAEPLSPFNVWQFGVGATFAVDRALLGAGGAAVCFDERLSNGRFCGGSEDVDFFYAAYVAGRTVCYVADAVVEHLFPPTAAAVSAKCRQYALTDGAFYAKWARRVSASDLRGEVTGWWGRIAKRRADRAAGRLAVPLSDLLAEPVYKLVGGVTWALVLRRSS